MRNINTIKIKKISELKNYLSNMALIIASQKLTYNNKYTCTIAGVKTKIVLEG